MAVYKVPQDVEAEDKLLGPFSFRQFIYLIAACLGIAAAWGLGRLFLPLAILPLPIILFFGALALPLRKDQPMEVYLAAIVSFHLKPRKRMWQPDGLTSLVEVTAPEVVEVQRAKALSQDEAARRLSYLADIVDTGGWSVRGVGAAAASSPITNEVYYEAQSTEDVMDEAAGIARNFDNMIEKNDQKRRQQLIDKMNQPAPAVFTPPAANEPSNLNFNPYPTNIHQSVIQPLSPGHQAGEAPVVEAIAEIAEPEGPPVAVAAEPPEPIRAPEPEIIKAPAEVPTTAPAPTKPPASTSTITVTPDIINLANQHDLSIETIAHEANRLKDKSSPDEEVVISLR